MHLPHPNFLICKMMGWTLNVLGVIVMFKQDIAQLLRMQSFMLVEKGYPWKIANTLHHAKALAYLRDLPMAGKQSSTVHTC